MESELGSQSVASPVAASSPIPENGYPNMFDTDGEENDDEVSSQVSLDFKGEGVIKEELESKAKVEWKVKIEIKQEFEQANPCMSGSGLKKEEKMEHVNIKGDPDLTSVKAVPVKREYKQVDNGVTPRRSSRRAKQPKRYDQSV